MRDKWYASAEVAKHKCMAYGIQLRKLKVLILRGGHNPVGITRTWRVHSITGMSTKRMAREYSIHQKYLQCQRYNLTMKSEMVKKKKITIKMQGIKLKEKQ